MDLRKGYLCCHKRKGTDGVEVSWGSGTVLAMQGDYTGDSIFTVVWEWAPRGSSGQRALDTWKWAGEKISEVALKFQSVKGIFCRLIWKQ